MVINWSVAPFFSFLFVWATLGERPRPSYAAILVLALLGIVIANPLAGGHVAGNLVALAGAALLLAGPGEPLATIAYPALGVELPGTGMIVGGAILLASGARLSLEKARRRAEAGAA